MSSHHMIHGGRVYSQHINKFSVQRTLVSMTLLAAFDSMVKD